MTANSIETIYKAVQDGVRGTFEHALSPEEAELFLELNVRNRRPRNSTSQQYAADMKAGRWKYAAETIKFGEDGILQDGQHRLLALASLKASDPAIKVLFLIATGLSADAQGVMDQGIRRSAGDNLGLQGVTSPNDVAAAARTYILWTSGRMFQDKTTAQGKVSNIEVQEWVMSHPEFAETVLFALKSKKFIDMRPSLYIATYAMFKDVDEQKANDFLTFWTTGEHLYLGHPIHTLREKLARIRRERQSATERDFLAFTTIAWNAFVAGQTLQRFARPSGGAWVKTNFPTPATPSLVKI